MARTAIGRASTRVGFAWARITCVFVVIVEHCAHLLGPHAGLLGFVTPPGFGRLGHLALLALFAMSGFQIADSWLSEPSWWRFAYKRVLRIWPPLLFVTMLSAFVLGPLVTTKSQADYWSSPITWAYVVDNAGLVHLRHPLPGVFWTNPYPYSVNGSLWTLPMEVFGYLVVLVFGVAGLLRRGRPALLPLTAGLLVTDALIGAGGTGAGAIGGFGSIPYGALLTMMAPFALGMVLRCYSDMLPLRPGVVLVLLPGFMVVNLFLPALAVPAAAVMVTYAAVVFALHVPARWTSASRWAYGSYGAFAMSFPLQQLLVFAGVRDEVPLVLLSVPLSYLAGQLSWYLIEKPTQRLRPKPLRPRRPDVPLAPSAGWDGRGEPGRDPVELGARDVGVGAGDGRGEQHGPPA